MHDGALAAGARPDDGCAGCPMAPNASVSVPGGPGGLDRRTFLALSRVCPHQGGTINTSSGGFTCSRHGARFSLTVQWLGGQQTSNMRSYATTFDPGTGALSIG